MNAINYGRFDDSSSAEHVDGLARVFDVLDYGVVLLDREGKLRYANRVASERCLGRGWLRLAEGRVLAADAALTRRLYAAIASAFGGRRRIIQLERQGETLPVALVPLAEQGNLRTCDEVLLVSGRISVCEPLSVELFGREIGLTGAETNVLRRLGCGTPPAKVASDCGVSMSTVRTHISSLRMKSGARTISELVRLLSLLPPVVPLLGDGAGTGAHGRSY